MSIALTPEAMNLAVTPTPGGTLTSDELAIQVSTDNTTGYTLTLALAGAETSLNDPASGGEIQSSTADINSPATLSVNTWGWPLSKYLGLVSRFLNKQYGQSLFCSAEQLGSL